MKDFKPRNLYYLRISEKSVLPVYVYLDERHLEWMSDLILQHVLSDLRPHILPKLRAEADALYSAAASKKISVDTHRGENYQFCYFLRKTEPHSVVIKTRNYIAKPSQSGLSMATLTSKAFKRRMRSSNGESRKKRRRKVQTSMDVEGPDAPVGFPEEGVSTSQPTPNDENAIIHIEESEGEDMDDEDYRPRTDALVLDLEEEEEKPKPSLQLKYQGFNIYGQCLCIVVEPWPAVRSNPERSESSIATTSAALQVPRITKSSAPMERDRTPLFLADDNDLYENDDEYQARMHDGGRKEFLEALDDSDEESDADGMLAFSQAINSAGDNRPGAADDDDEMEGTALFGDADEAKELRG